MTVTSRCEDIVELYIKKKSETNLLQKASKLEKGMIRNIILQVSACSLQRQDMRGAPNFFCFRKQHKCGKTSTIDCSFLGSQCSRQSWLLAPLLDLYISESKPYRALRSQMALDQSGKFWSRIYFFTSSSFRVTPGYSTRTSQKRAQSVCII